jgi:hypothetical protein
MDTLTVVLPTDVAQWLRDEAQELGRPVGEFAGLVLAAAVRIKRAEDSDLSLCDQYRDQ